MKKRPTWLDNAVFYEIYPQSFLDTDGDGIGNINGITEKLSYIRELGCNALWINPCFVSPFLDAGYDVSDYRRVAPRYGTNEDLFRLFEEAHRLGIHVLLDLVPGHTSWDHPWFKDSMKAARNACTDRYIWTDSVWESPEGFACIRGISQRDGSCVTNFFTHQPALNYGFLHPDQPWQQAMDAPGPMATREAIKDVMRFWLSHGCDGFRVDMAGSLVKNDPDCEGTIALWQDFRAFLEGEFPEAAMISEWGDPDKSLQGGFHMDFLLHFGPSHYNDLFRCASPFFEGNGDASQFVARYRESYDRSKQRGLICIPSGNHDMDRLARHVHTDNRKLSFAFLLSMPGAPFVYYGDEIGMRFVEDIPSVEGGYGRTGSRSPMQWNAAKNAGFSSGEKLYVPLDPSADRPTVEAEKKDEHSLWHEIQKLIGVRQKHKALQSNGKISFLRDGGEGLPLAYVREAEDEQILVVINPRKTPCEISLEELGKIAPVEALDQKCGECIYCFGTEPEFSDGRLTAMPKSAVFIKM